MPKIIIHDNPPVPCGSGDTERDVSLVILAENGVTVMMTAANQFQSWHRGKLVIRNFSAAISPIWVNRRANAFAEHVVEVTKGRPGRKKAAAKPSPKKVSKKKVSKKKVSKKKVSAKKKAA